MDDQLARTLSTLFSPTSVAVVGASTDLQKLSGIPLPNLLRSRFAGKVYVVNPRAPEICGVKAYPSIAEIPGEVDVAFIVVSGDGAVQATREAAAKGVKLAVVAVSGFAEEATPEGIARQAELRRIARETGTRVVGPNCNGIYNAPAGISLGYNSAHADTLPAGGLSVISHSGALFSVVARRMQTTGVGLALFVSVGNEADLELLDYAEYCAEDEHTRVIGLIVEAISDGARLAAITRRAQARGKHVVALKLGQSDSGSRATAAHSSRLAGSARAYLALFRDLGIPTVRTVEGLVAAAAVLQAAPSRAGADGREPGIGAMTYSGAGGSLLADAAARNCLRLTAFSNETTSALDEHRKFAPIVNPVDLGGTGTGAMPEVAARVAEDPGVDAVVLYGHVLQTRENQLRGPRVLGETRRATGKVHVVVAPGTLTDEEEAGYVKEDVLLFHDTEVALEGIGAYFATLRHANGRMDGAPHAAPTPLPEDEALRPLERGGPLGEAESLTLLRSYGVPCVPWTVAHSADEAATAAAALGWPVVMKGVVPGVAHKARQGLVALGLRDAAALRTAFDEMAARSGAGSALAVLVQPMLSVQLEAFVGLASEPGLGKFLVAGLGGIHTEELDDAVLWSLPTTRERILAELPQTRLGRILASGTLHEATAEQLADVILAVQALALGLGDRVHSVDVNPVAFTERGPVALDGLIIPTPKTPVPEEVR